MDGRPVNGPAQAENTPRLETERLILRRFTRADAGDLFAILRDREANRFLPWFPAETPAQAEARLERYLEQYRQPVAYAYAIALRQDDRPIGYVQLSDPGGSSDLGYGLRREFWHRGIATEACRAVTARLKQSGLPFLTATHDVQNPRSGAVMRKLGMTYCYTYEELWQPKNIPVLFRLYQLNLDGDQQRVYRAYWERYPRHFIEELP